MKPREQINEETTYSQEVWRERIGYAQPPGAASAFTGWPFLRSAAAKPGVGAPGRACLFSSL
jgi:hypothetical protein